MTGLTEVEANLDLAIAEIAAASREAAISSVEEFVEDAKALAPVLTTERSDRKPGDLRDSIEILDIVETPERVVVTAGTTKFYAEEQEFGTARDPGHPYIRPARAKMEANFVPQAAAKIRSDTKALA